MKKTPKQPPSQILQDHEGNWYLVPETHITRFEQALAIIDEDDARAFSKIKKIAIGSPQSLRILVWEEMT